MENFLVILLAVGLVWWFTRRTKTSHNNTEANPAPVLMDAKHGVYFTPPTAGEERFAALHREATQHKDKGDWAKAIACLREAERLEPNMAVKSALRLPLFLQQAGSFDEAMVEFQKLIDKTEARVLSCLPKRNISSKTMLMHADFMNIYQSMSTACKREKLQEKADTFAEIAKDHKAKHAKMLKLRQENDEKKAAERKNKRRVTAP